MKLIACATKASSMRARSGRALTRIRAGALCISSGAGRASRNAFTRAFARMLRTRTPYCSCSSLRVRNSPGSGWLRFILDEGGKPPLPTGHWDGLPDALGRGSKAAPPTLGTASGASLDAAPHSLRERFPVIVKTHDDDNWRPLDGSSTPANLCF